MATRRQVNRHAKRDTKRPLLKRLWEDYQAIYRILAGVCLVLLGMYLGAVLFASDGGYFTNLYTEAIGIAVTVFVLDGLNRWRDRQQSEQDKKKNLIRNIGSPDNATALNAARELVENRWLQDGCLNGANLTNANLEGATLYQAKLRAATLAGAILKNASLEESDLEGAVFIKADLHNADLREANLSQAVAQFADFSKAKLEFALMKNAMMTGVNLQQAQLDEADLQFANLAEADLSHADLHHANLEGADLGGAILKGVNFIRANLCDVNFRTPMGNLAVLDESTILPDGTKYKHGNGIKALERFTDPDHPEFWTPEDARNQEEKDE